MSNVHVFDHPLIQHKLSILRDKNTKLQKVYTEGRRMDDALVKKIGKNYVIFERQGREEILKMKP